MISSLTQKPRPCTVMEWFLATLVDPIYKAAQETGILSELVGNCVHSDALAERLGLSERGVRCILNCLVASGILIKENDRYHQINQDVPEIFHRTTNAVRTLVHAVEDGVFDQVTEDGILPSNAPQELSQLGITEVMGSQQVLTGPGHHYFTPDQDRYLGFYLSRTWELRTHVIIPRLAETIKIGRSAMQNKSNSTHFSSTAKMFFSLNNDPAQQLANHLVSLEGVNTALDLGAGSAVWSIPLAQRKHNLHVDALDLLPVLDATRAFTERYGVQKQYSFLPGDFLTLDRWGQGSYDLIYMGYVCCMSSRAENQSLLTRCVRNLRPGGYLALADFFPKPDRTGPFRDVLFSVQMLISIDGGDTYDPETYEGWCRDAGLSELAWIPVPALDVPLLIARKATI